MTIINLHPDTLIPYPGNAKKHDARQIANVAESMRRYGIVQPLVIDKDNVIVIGHCRAMAARKLGLDSVPCVRVDELTPEEVNALRIVDNKTSESPWDFDLLAAELEGLDFEGFDLDWDLPETEAPAHFWGDGEGETNEEYEEFVDKFTPKLTTDDCYTPENIYAVVRDWVVQEYGLEGAEIVRPFYPGGDYEHYRYPDNCVVIDNPPFSMLSSICRFYMERGIRFFLFAQTMTLFSSASGEANYILAGVKATYENGANINTSFVTNMGEYKIDTAPELGAAFEAENTRNEKARVAELPTYTYPDEVITSKSYLLSKYGQRFRVKADECRFIRALDAQKTQDKAIYGGGFLLSEKAAAEKAAAEKAAAEKVDAHVWELSEREWQIIKEMSV